MEKWERRERKLRAKAARMPKSGLSVRLIERILLQKANAAKAKRDVAQVAPKNQRPSK